MRYALWPDTKDNDIENDYSISFGSRELILHRMEDVLLRAKK